MDNINFLSYIRQKPHAIASMKGSSSYADIQGTVSFYQTKAGVLVAAQISGLPVGDNSCDSKVFAMHIHSGGRCSGNETDLFADAMTHYNPDNCAHPYHAGDMPPVFGANGFAFSMFLTDRFSVQDVLGKTVIIHSNPDDFTTQPAGNSGTKIACGVII